eukprot:1885124-Rhodomonas_salina.1
MGAGASKEARVSRENPARPPGSKVQQKTKQKSANGRKKSVKEAVSPSTQRVSKDSISAQKLFDAAAGNSDTISLDGLYRAIAAAEIAIPEAELESLFAEMDGDGDGVVSREDFINGWSTKPYVDALEGWSTTIRAVRSPGLT